LKSWRIELKPSAEKQYLRLDGRTRHRIKAALQALEQTETPLLHPRVRSLTGPLKGDYRLRIGDWRVLFTPDRESKVIRVYAVLPRGDAY
jgi:mRNA interferase RelE/StbE